MLFIGYNSLGFRSRKRRNTVCKVCDSQLDQSRSTVKGKVPVYIRNGGRGGSNVPSSSSAGSPAIRCEFTYVECAKFRRGRGMNLRKLVEYDLPHPNFNTFRASHLANLRKIHHCLVLFDFSFTEHRPFMKRNSTVRRPENSGLSSNTPNFDQTSGTNDPHLTDGKLIVSSSR
jgi:hypothetical protein